MASCELTIGRLVSLPLTSAKVAASTHQRQGAALTGTQAVVKSVLMRRQTLLS
jgi:hypothetical protein